MNFFRKAWLVLKYLGPGWVAFRLSYAWEKRTGALKRRSPLKSWNEIPASAKLPDWLKAPQLPESAKGWGNRCVTEADGVALGEFILFSHHQKHLGMPPNWYHNAFTGQTAPRGQHWSALGDFDFGDIKAIWEPNRFGWAFTLARAHARTGEARLAELFWKLFEDWCAQNPPNDGVNWKCGQEATFRLMAVTFAIAKFGRLPSATEARIKLWSRFVTATGLRIKTNLNYALSQANNHGVSECVGEIIAGLLMEESTETNGLCTSGLISLRSQLDSLIYADGGFSQHSLVYHRVLLCDLLWLIHLLSLSGRDTPDWLIGKVKQALAFLHPLVDAETGGAPLFGANDGSNILPLDECAYDDLRGVVQAGFALLDGVRVYAPGPWDESAFWLIGKDPAAFPLRACELTETWHAQVSGYFQWYSGAARIFFICPTKFLHRPAQADMLHVDMWWKGRPIAHDAGTYSYNTPGVFGGALSLAAAHNVPMLAGREPLQKASRFLYLPWPQGTSEWIESEKRFRATHDGYGGEAQIERSITNSTPEIFTVTDKITVRQPRSVRLRWLLADADWKLDEAARTVTAKFDTENYTISWVGPIPVNAVSLIRAEVGTARGWWSRHYLAVEPAVSLELLFDVEKELVVTTRFAPDGR